ncbi:hypothetical protein ACFSQ7_19080 [Paenibacillus rhizoplanae]
MVRGMQMSGKRVFLNYAARYPNVKVVQIAYTSSSTSDAENLTREMLNKYPKLRGIATLNEIASQGAARVIQGLKRDSVKMIAF